MMHTSVHAFAQHVLCSPVLYGPELDRPVAATSPEQSEYHQSSMNSDEQQVDKPVGKKLSERKCNQCGIERRLPLTCPRDCNDDPGRKVEVRVYKVMDHKSANGNVFTQNELTTTKMTGLGVMTAAKQIAKKTLPHMWDATTDLHHRRLCGETFDDLTLIVYTDFSSKYNCESQDKPNSSQPAHVILDVFVTSSNPRFVDLGNASDSVSDDNYFHIQSLIYILKNYHNNLKGIKKLILMTDGCAAQYKSRQNCYELANLFQYFPDLDHIWHVWAPTASFKTFVDGAGMVEKHFLRTSELYEKGRMPDARACFEYCDANMPAVPERDLKTHFLVVDKFKATEEDKVNPKVCLIDRIHDRNWDVKPVKGIQSKYAIRIDRNTANINERDRLIYIKTHPCWCADCRLDVTGNSCKYKAIYGTWTPTKVVRLTDEELAARDEKRKRAKHDDAAADHTRVEGGFVELDEQTAHISDMNQNVTTQVQFVGLGAHICAESWQQ
eukprot:gene22553-28689_t